MKRSRLPLVLACAMLLVSLGCHRAPGRPGPDAYARRPDQVLDFTTLYAENCAGCHGARGLNGAAISLANATYLHYAGATRVLQLTAEGIPASLMPPFAKSRGGMLTDQQIGILTRGMISAWSGSSSEPTPAYTPSSAGNAVAGQQVFTAFCARCHGADGTGVAMPGGQPGSLVDPAYLALISNAGLRSIVVAGQPEQGMPNWQHDGPRPLTEPEITNVVAWLAQHRIATPGQIYAQHPNQATEPAHE